MRTFLTVLVLGVLLTCVVSHGQESEEPQAKQLQPGKYDMRLVTPSMPESNRDITLPAELVVEKEGILVNTQGKIGNKVVLRGLMEKSNVKVGMTAVEKGCIVSFHYVGKVESETTGQGDFYVFVDGASAFSGKWTLTKKADEPQNEEPQEREEKEPK